MRRLLEWTSHERNDGPHPTLAALRGRQRRRGGRPFGVRPWAAAAAGSGYLTRSAYAGLEGTHFTVETGAKPVVLRLESVADVAGAASRRALVGSDDAFALTFSGPIADPLDSGIHTMRHPSLGSFELFSSPVDTPDGNRLYEIVVDRSVGVRAAPRPQTRELDPEPSPRRTTSRTRSRRPPAAAGGRAARVAAARRALGALRGRVLRGPGRPSAVRRRLVGRAVAVARAAACRDRPARGDATGGHPPSRPPARTHSSSRRSPPTARPCPSGHSLDAALAAQRTVHRAGHLLAGACAHGAYEGGLPALGAQRAHIQAEISQ